MYKCVTAIHSLSQQAQIAQYNTVQYSTVQYSTIQYSTVQYSTVQYSTLQYSTVQYNAVMYNRVQYSTVQYSTVQHSTVQYSTIQVMLCFSIQGKHILLSCLVPLVDQSKLSELEEEQEKNGLRHQDGNTAHSRWTRNSSFRGSITEEDVADNPLVMDGHTDGKAEQKASLCSSTCPEEGKKREFPPVSQVNASLNNFLDMQEKESTSTANTRSATPDNDQAALADYVAPMSAESTTKTASQSTPVRDIAAVSSPESRSEKTEGLVSHKDVQEGSPVTAV